MKIPSSTSSPLNPVAMAFPGDRRNVLDAPPHFLDAFPVAIYACDAGGRVRWFNRRAADLWGREPRLNDDGERFTGAYKFYSLDGQPLDRDQEPMAEVLRTGVALHDIEMIYERLDGSCLVVMVDINPLRGTDGAVTGAISCFRDTTSQREAEQRLREHEGQSRALLEALPAAVYTVDGTGRITSFNASAVHFWGGVPDIEDCYWSGAFRLFWPNGQPLAHGESPTAVAIKENQPVHGFEAELERPDGTRVPFLAFATPLSGRDGRLIGAVDMLIDITERKQAEERQKLLNNELNHRVKNSLATVQSVVLQSLRNVKSLEEGRRTIETRLFALAQAHDLLTAANWGIADFALIVHRALVTHCADPTRLHVAGQSLMLPSRMLLPFAMVMHELCTNAVKYGALSVQGGSVAVTWMRYGSTVASRLAFQWQEQGGPSVEPPRRKGFGTRLIEHGLAAELKGEVVLAYPPTGVTCTIDVPISDPEIGQGDGAP